MASLSVFAADIESFVDTLLEEWGTVFTHNWKLCVCVVLGFLMTVALPLVGILWCHKHRRGKYVPPATNTQTLGELGKLDPAPKSFSLGCGGG